MMKIHLLDTFEKPRGNTLVSVNCGKQVKFNPVKTDFDDGRICGSCLIFHREAPPAQHTNFTFTIIE